MVESSAETAIPAEERMTSAEERAIFAEGRAQQAEDNLLSQGQGDRFDRWIEFFSAIALALATVLTAWCGYQAALWGGEQTQATSDATDARMMAGQQSNQAMLRASIQVGLFTDYANAFAQENDKLANFYYKRFPEPLKSATDAWLATDPLHNPDAPLSPFDMAQYKLPEQAEAARLTEVAQQKADESQKANEQGDHYMLMTVIFATALFFCGISGKFQWRMIDLAMLVLGALVIVGGVVILMRTPML